MDIKDMLTKIDHADRKIDRFIDRLIGLVAFIFGAWLVWTVLSATDLSLFMRLGVSAIGGIITALIVRIIWFLANLFN